MEPIPPGLSPDQAYFIEHGRYPDITPTEHRNAALVKAFNGLDAILSTQFELPTWGVQGVNSDGVSLNLVTTDFCGGDRIVTEETVFFSWDELSDPDLFLGQVAQARWDANRAEAVRKAHVAKMLKQADEERRARRAADEAHAKKSESDRAELRKLMAAYPDEVNRALFTNMPTTAP